MVFFKYYARTLFLFLNASHRIVFAMIMVMMSGDDGYVAFLNNKNIYDCRDTIRNAFLVYILHQYE